MYSQHLELLQRNQAQWLVLKFLDKFKTNAKNNKRLLVRLLLLRFE